MARWASVTTAVMTPAAMKNGAATAAMRVACGIRPQNARRRFQTPRNT
jgi:hypothetical protein